MNNKKRFAWNILVNHLSSALCKPKGEKGGGMFWRNVDQDYGGNSYVLSLLCWQPETCWFQAFTDISVQKGNTQTRPSMCTQSYSVLQNKRWAAKLLPWAKNAILWVNFSPFPPSSTTPETFAKQRELPKPCGYRDISERWRRPYMGLQ